MDALPVTTHEHAGEGRVLATRVVLTAAGDLEVTSDVMTAHRLPDEGGRVRVALVAPVARTGHDGRLDVEVAAGRELEIVEVTGSGAHDVRHARTQWHVHVRLAQDALLLWPSLPIMVAEGADVLRLVHVDLAPGARVVLRETLVVGRAGQPGGRIRSTISARIDGRPLLAETFVVEPSAPLCSSLLPTLDAPPAPRPPADDERLDTLLVLGARLDHPDALQLEHAGSMLRGPSARDHDADLADVLTTPRC